MFQTFTLDTLENGRIGDYDIYVARYADTDNVSVVTVLNDYEFNQYVFPNEDNPRFGYSTTINYKRRIRPYFTFSS